MKNRYVLEPVTLDKQHFRDPLKEVWKIYDMKNQRYVRSYYDTFTLSVNDSPRPNEILVLFAGASRGRINARLGGLDENDVSGIDGLKSYLQVKNVGISLS